MGILNILKGIVYLLLIGVLILFGASMLPQNGYNNPAQYLIQEVQKHTGIPAPQNIQKNTSPGPPDTNDYSPDDSNGCIGGKKTYDSEYMTFEYPENWIITGHATNEYGGEDVELQDKDNMYGISIMSATNENPQKFEDDLVSSGFEWSGTKEIGNVECNIYEGDHGRVYVFQKDGTSFRVDGPIEVEYVIEDIIKSIKAKK